jgi:hypothetical protein
MKYEEIELGQARQAFVVALLGKMKNQITTQKKKDEGEDEEYEKKSFPPSSRAHTQIYKGKKDLPAGF